MNPRMAVPVERDQVCRMVMGCIIITVVDVEVPGGSADHAPVAVPLPDRVPGRPPGWQAILGADTDGLSEPDAEQGFLAAFREWAGIAECPVTVDIRPVPACRIRFPVKRRKAGAGFQVSCKLTGTENGPGGIRTPDIRVRSPALYPG